MCRWARRIESAVSGLLWKCVDGRHIQRVLMLAGAPFPDC
jgi:hypothetical protein